MEVEQQCNEEKNSKSTTHNVQPEAFFEKAYELAGKAAGTELGQFAIEKIDRVLSALEKTAKWSLPPIEIADKDTPAPALERPLPWIPFLATIVALRAVRLSVSFASILIGNDPVSPCDVVQFLQTRRRKLRAIKYHGLRAIRLKKQDNLDRQRRGVIGKLTSIFGLVVCRTEYRNDTPTRVVVKRKSKNSQKKTPKSVLNANNPQEKKLLQNDEDESESDDDLPCDQLLDRYAEVNDSEDPDFVLEVSQEENSSDSSECPSEDDQVMAIERRLLDLDRKREEDDMEKKKEFIDHIIQEKRQQIENEIKNKLETQIEERIEKHAQVLKAQFDEKLEELQEIKENSEHIENPTSISINPAKLSPKIAHNGNAEENKHDKHEKTQFNATGFKGSPDPEKLIENHASVKDILKQREPLENIESSAPFIENEVKAELQIHLKQANSHKKSSSINTVKGVKGRKTHN